MSYTEKAEDATRVFTQSGGTQWEELEAKTCWKEEETQVPVLLLR